MLTLTLLTFAGQPCNTIPMQVNIGCCGDGYSDTCHRPAPAKSCAMQSTDLAPPEVSVPVIVVLAISFRVDYQAATTLFQLSEVARAENAGDSSRLYLRNSILLI